MANFYALMYLSDKNDSINSPTKNSNQKIIVYLKNACVLARSLYETFGVGLTVLTNDPLRCQKLVEEFSTDAYLKFVEIDFCLPVPDDIGFYSAHFKIDVFRYFSSLKSQYSILIDLDVICLRKISDCVSNLLKNRVPVVYDITDQVIQEYGDLCVIADLEKIGAKSSVYRWLGGGVYWRGCRFF